MVLLSTIWLLPLISAFLVAFMPPRWSKLMSAAAALVTLGIATLVVIEREHLRAERDFG